MSANFCARVSHQCPARRGFVLAQVVLAESEPRIGAVNWRGGLVCAGKATPDKTAASPAFGHNANYLQTYSQTYKGMEHRLP